MGRMGGTESRKRCDPARTVTQNGPQSCRANELQVACAGNATVIWAKGIAESCTPIK